jgi:hypothetical protein
MFVDIQCSRDELIDKIIDFTGGKRELLRTIITSFGEVDVIENKAFYSDKKQHDNFLYYMYYLDIEPSIQSDEMEYIASIRKLLRQFKLQGTNVVAACDFESELV